MVNATNVTASSIVEPIPQTGEPGGVGSGTIDLGGGRATPGAMLCNSLFLIPFGGGTAAQTFTMKCYAWNLTTSRAAPAGLWVPTILASFTCTLCTQAGVANSDVPLDDAGGNTNLFCGTIALVVGNANVSNEIISPTGNVIASIVLDAKGANKVAFVFSTGSSAASCNCLAKRL